VADEAVKLRQGTTRKLRAMSYNRYNPRAASKAGRCRQSLENALLMAQDLADMQIPKHFADNMLDFTKAIADMMDLASELQDELTIDACR